MILLTHIIIAISSLALTAVSVIKPSERTMKASSILIAMTLASGSVVIVTLNAGLVHACLSGLFFTGLSLYGISVSKKKFAYQKQ